MFLGIDHTAMTVRSSESSIKFYRDLLGLTVTGGTLNMGTEQEHLDSLPGACALAKLLLGPVPIPVPVSTSRTTIPLHIRCDGCCAAIPNTQVNHPQVQPMPFL